MSDETKRWVEAGKVLSENANAKVICPHCQIGELEVTDVSPPFDATLIERHMRCPICGAKNAILLRRPVARDKG